MSKTDLPISEWFQLGSKEGAKAREEYIRDNADYFYVVWREFPEYKKVRFDDLVSARNQAQFAADYLQKPVMIYSVIEIPNTENGYDSLVEVVHPHE